MRTRIMGAFLAIVMLLGLASAVPAFAATEETTPRILSFHNEFDTLEAINSSVLTIDYSELDAIENTAKEIVDSGTMIYITNPASSAESIAARLSIPKSNITLYQNLLLVAYSIYKIDEGYVFANHYAALAHEGEENGRESNTGTDVTTETNAPETVSEAQAISNVILMRDYTEQRFSYAPTIDPIDVLSTAISAKSDTEATAQNITAPLLEEPPSIIQPRSSTLPSTTATQTWNDTLSVYGLNNTYYGYLNCTVYGYGKGTGTVNGSNKKIYDVISVVKAYPESNYKVKRYETQLRCNFTGFSNLQTTTLPSGTTYSQGISLTGSYGSSGGSGGGTYTTSWTYNPESQTITESSSAPRIVKWKAEPSNPTSGKAYDIAPGMRVASPTHKMRGAFSKVYCDAMILGFTVNANSLEVGGCFKDC